MNTIKPRPLHTAKVVQFESFFARDSHRRHIPSRQARHVPRKTWDPIAALVWLVAAPLCFAGGWYGIYRLARLIWSLL